MIVPTPTQCEEGLLALIVNTSISLISSKEQKKPFQFFIFILML